MSPSIGFTDSAHFKALDDLSRSYTDLHLSYCGFEDTYPGFVFGPTVRHEYVLHIVKSGKGSFMCSGKTWHLKENQVFLICPDTETSYQADHKKPWSYFWIGFNGLLAHEIIASAGFSINFPVKDINCLELLYSFVDQLIALRFPSFANELRRNGILMQFWATLIEEHSAVTFSSNHYTSPGSSLIRSAVDFMAHNYDSSIKIAELSDRLGLNRSTFTNSFKNAMGISPQKYLLTLRMNKAASLLKNTSFNVAEIALQVGYNDPLAFSRIFRKWFGLGPRAFREAPDVLVTTTEKWGYSNQEPL
jgi:AraC-like DNA-binding protein